MISHFVLAQIDVWCQSMRLFVWYLAFRALSPLLPSVAHRVYGLLQEQGVCEGCQYVGVCLFRCVFSGLKLVLSRFFGAVVSLVQWVLSSMGCLTV